MSELVVPISRAGAGQAAPAMPMPTPKGGAALSELGQKMFEIGTAVEDDRLSRELQRLQVDMTRDLNALRLETERYGDPDAAETAWSRGLETIAESYRQPGADGRPRLDPKNEERFGLAFDQLANTHGFGLGKRTLELRQSQREAQHIELAQASVQSYATGEPELRDDLAAQYDADVDAMVAQGIYSAAEGQSRKIAFRSEGDKARAIAMIDADPAGFLEAMDAGEMGGLDATSGAQYRKQANAAIARREEAAQQAADKAAQEREKAIGQRLDEIIDIYSADRTPADAAWLESPDVQAHPKYAEAKAAEKLHLDHPHLASMAPFKIDAILEAERAKPVGPKYDLNREKVLVAARDKAVEGWSTDPVAFSRTLPNKVLAYPELPDPATAAPEELAAGLTQRVTHAAWLTGQGHTDSPVFLSAEEKARLSEAAGVNADPSRRLEIAMALRRGLAQAGAGAMEQISDDPVFLHTSGLVAATGNRAIGIEAFRGQQVQDQGNVLLPPVPERRAPVFSTVQTLFADLQGGEEAQAAITATADALYAARVRRTDPGNEAAAVDEKLYRQALHEAMGGSGSYKSTTASKGGIHEIRGQQTIVPPAVSAGSVIDAMDMLGTVPAKGILGRDTSRFDPGALDRQLRAMSIDGQAPMIDGNPIEDADDLEDLQLRAIGNDRYVLMMTLDGVPQALPTADGSEYVFSMRGLIREAGK